MFQFNILILILISFIILLLYVLHKRLMLPQEYRNISSYVPSATNSIWSELLVSLDVAMSSAKEKMPYARELFKKYGPVVHVSLAGRSYVLINDPNDIRALLTSTKHIDKGPEYEMLKPWLNEGLLTRSGANYHNRRKLLARIFHTTLFHKFNEQVNRHARVLTKNLLMASEAADHDGAINISESVSLCSFDMTCETIMGIQMNAQQGKSIEYLHLVKSVLKSVNKRIVKFWQWNDFIYRISTNGRNFYRSVKVLQQYTDNVIKDKRTLLNKSKTQKMLLKNNNKEIMQEKSFMEMLINLSDEYPDQMTDLDIREEINTFLLGGHDTTSIAMTMVLALLGIHQDIQNEARNEMHSIFGKTDRYATMEDLNAMKYLEAVIKETLRMYPSIPAISRKLKTSLKITNYTLPPKTVVVVIPYILHRTESIYSNAEEFVPERFLDEGNKSKYSFAYLPFSAGPRICIGQKFAMNEIKTVVSTILRKTRFKAFGRVEDISVAPELVIKIHSLPKIKFYEN